MVVVGDVRKPLLNSLAERAKGLKVGYGLDESSQMGPLVSKKAKDRVLNYVENASATGANLVLDGRTARVEGYERGYYLGPTIFDRVDPETPIAHEEIFGPVASVIE